MSNSKKLPDLSEKSVESINSGDSRLAANLNINCSEVRRLMNNSSDLIIKYFSSDGHRMAVITCEGMIGKADLANLIFRPLVSAPPKIQDDNEFFTKVCSDMPIAEEQKQVYDYDSLCLYIMSGFAVLLCDGAGFGIAIGIQGFAHRSVDEPSTHINLRASREGFIEVVRTNVAMVRRRMKSPTLKTIMMTVGERSKTDVSVCYLTDKADMNIVNAVTDKLKNIPLNTIAGGEYLQSFLEDDDSVLFLTDIYNRTSRCICIEAVRGQSGDNRGRNAFCACSSVSVCGELCNDGRLYAQAVLFGISSYHTFLCVYCRGCSAGSLCRTVQLPPGNVPLGTLAEYLFIGADYRLSRIRRVPYNVYPV